MTTLSITDSDGNKFTFSNLEIPESINFGGKQAMAVQKLVGGMRTINPMGRDDADITWSGIFKGPTALDRARYLDGLRIAGKPVTFTYSQFLYTAVISDFTANFQRNSFQIPFSITFVVLEDNTTPISIVVPDTIDTAVQNALIEVEAIAALIADPSFSSSIAALSGLVSQFNPLGSATGPQINSILAQVQSAQGLASNAISTSSGKLFGSL